MHQVELIRDEWTGRPPVVEFYKVPIRGPDDYQCEPRRLISFEQAKRISRDLAFGFTTGEIDQWKWRAGEFSFCPMCDRPVEEGLPLCPHCESILAPGGSTPAEG